MKKFITLCFIICISNLKAQFTESFFEFLNRGDSYSGHYYGTNSLNYALGVKFADSLDTEVQWAKLDQFGNYQTYSSHLLTNDLNPNERIIEVFESGSNQFIVTQDSETIGEERLRIYKYQNYTISSGVLDFPVDLRNAYHQSYFKFGKIYIFYYETGVGLKFMKVNPSTLVVEQNIILGNFIYPVQNINDNYKLTHVLFSDENNMQVFTSNNSNLLRIKVINNIPSIIETKNIGLIKIFGVNSSMNKLICLTNHPSFEVKKYIINSSMTLNDISISDSLDLDISSSNYSKVKYANDNGTKEIFVDETLNLINYFENNNIDFSKSIVRFDKISNIIFMNNLPLIFGTNNLCFNDDFNNFFCLLNALVISNGFKSSTNFHKEYISKINFGDFELKSGFGNYLIGITNEISDNTNYIFKNMISYSNMNIVAKENSILYGKNSEHFGLTFKPGPYTINNNYSQDIIHEYNENFYVDKDMLNYHVYAIANNISSYRIPNGILNWPAHGDVTKGQAQYLAPFVDLDMDGNYDPTEGEYPSFPGTRCLLNISHQHETDYQNSGLGLELHSYVYNFECEDSIKDVVFYKTEIFNRTSRNYDSLAIGIYNDFDLGYFNDDYVGTNVENGLLYVYNGDNFDDNLGSHQGFNDSLPTFANIFLKGVKLPSNAIDDTEGITSFQSVNGFGFEDGIVDNEYSGLERSFVISESNSMMSEANSNLQFFNYLNGKWRFGDTLFFGGTGFAGSTGVTTIPSKYSYPGESDPMFYGTGGIDPGFYWSEEQNNNIAGDKRTLGSFGSTPLNAGEKVEYHFAYLAGKRVPGMGQSQIDLFAKAAHVKNAFNSNLTSCGQTFDNLTEDQITSVSKKDAISFVKLYPNPSKDKINIQIPQGNHDVEIDICDINGRVYIKSSLKSTLNTIDISDLKNGLYLVRVSIDGKTEIEKFIKN